MTWRRRDALRRGAIDVAPIIAGLLPFGLIAGVAAIEAGLGLPEAVGFSIAVFAGASQLAALDLLGDGATAPVAIGAILVINLRMVMYSASLSPWFAAVSRPRRLGAAYVLTDQTFALAVTRYQQHPDDAHRLSYYVGAAVPMWLAWQAATIVGAGAGSALPEEIPLGFALPLVFLVLLVPAVTDRATSTAAVAAAVVAVVAAPLPANLGLPLAIVVGIIAGVAVSSTSGRVRTTGGHL